MMVGRVSSSEEGWLRIILMAAGRVRLARINKWWIVILISCILIFNLWINSYSKQSFNKKAKKSYQSRNFSKLWTSWSSLIRLWPVSWTITWRMRPYLGVWWRVPWLRWVIRGSWGVIRVSKERRIPPQTPWLDWAAPALKASLWMVERILFRGMLRRQLMKCSWGGIRRRGIIILCKSTTV